MLKASVTVVTSLNPDIHTITTGRKNKGEGSIPLDETACRRLGLAAVRQPPQIDAEQTRLFGGASGHEQIGRAHV